MPDRSWKACERAIAALVGGERVPVTGRARGDQPDIHHPAYAFEIKHRKSIPDWLKDALAQALASRRDEQLPIVVLHEAGKRHTTDLVLMRFADWLQLARQCPPDRVESPRTGAIQEDASSCL